MRLPAFSAQPARRFYTLHCAAHYFTHCAFSAQHFVFLILLALYPSEHSLHLWISSHGRFLYIPVHFVLVGLLYCCLVFRLSGSQLPYFFTP
ncbi:hypothetical protein F4861DRAFT_445755 [Xylaria intraflava]|nr:hypothetical protein F4861DRAFT_445755 [Xylaria intraflava]